MRRQQMPSDPEMLGLDVVRIRDHPAPDVGGGTGNRGYDRAEESARARLRDGDGQPCFGERSTESGRLGERRREGRELEVSGEARRTDVVHRSAGDP
jgi:hypothetical protein